MLQNGRTPLHESMIQGDAATTRSLITAGANVRAKDKNGAVPLDLATDGTCRNLLKHHCDVLSSLAADPSKFARAALEHCTILSAPDESAAESTVLPLCAYQLNPSFLWAPPAARAAMIAWARDVYIIQFATATEPCSELPDDCSGDIFEYLNLTMTRCESLHVAMHCSSSVACAWVHAIVKEAVMVRWFCLL